jgi:hypothetical protein
MKVHDSVDLGNGHLIEFGQATWDAVRKSQLFGGTVESWRDSLRNRYPNETGGYNRVGSSEIPLRDVAAIAVETLQRDLLSPEETTRILQAAQSSINRRV